jgi:DNA polymerase
VINLDFETYSEAGYVWTPDAGRSKLGAWKGKGIGAVGAAVYAEHPTCEVLCLSWYQNWEPRVWLPGTPAPGMLFDHIARGGLLSASNSGFERHIWEYVCVARMGWPEVPREQWRCSQAKARLVGVPGKLKLAAEYLSVPTQKNPDGMRLIKLLSCPRSPTKTDARRRITMADVPVDAAKMVAYCADDVLAERGVDAALPPMSEHELRIWQLDQDINARGVAVDSDGLQACIDVLELARPELNEELRELSGGAVESADAVQALRNWIDPGLDCLDSEKVGWLLEHGELAPDKRRALEIRQALGSKSVSKVYAMRDMLSGDGRLRDLFAYCGATRTRRWAGRGPQPQNLPKATLPNGHSVDSALQILATRDMAFIRATLGDPVEAIKACLRGLFVAKPEHDLIASVALATM